MAFSGGPDSLALLAALARLRPWLGTRIFAVHIDHALRTESAAEAARAVELATQLMVPCVTRRLETGIRDRIPSLGLEEAVRRERYQMLAESAAEVDAEVIAVGHQREDQAEAALLHLARGAGLSGARAMSEWVQRDIPWWLDADRPPSRLWLWRPLLQESRRELVAYLERLGFSPIHDESNDDLAFRRNRVRHVVLPTIERELPGAALALARFGALVAEDDDALDQMARSALAEALTEDGAFRAAPMNGYHLAVQRRAIRHWLAEAVPDVEISMDRAEAVRRLAVSSAGGKAIEVGAGATVLRRRGQLRAVRRDQSWDEASTTEDREQVRTSDSIS